MRLGLEQVRLGLPVTDEIITPGVLTYGEYVKRRATWDRVRQCIGLDGLFYEGGELLLFPPLWLDRAEGADLYALCQRTATEAIGIDTAEGGDKTAMAATNRYGLKELVSRQTPDTNVIVGEAAAFAMKHNVPWTRVVFDRGGGGKEHADRMRARGKMVRTVGFGEHPSLPIKRGLHQLEKRKDIAEEKYQYLNLRAQMYHEVSLIVDPALGDGGFPGFCIPSERQGGPVYAELRRQLAVMPKLTDEEGRYWMLPKTRKDPDKTSQRGGMRSKTLMELLGSSPDEADALVLAVHGMTHEERRAQAKVG